MQNGEAQEVSREPYNSHGEVVVRAGSKAIVEHENTTNRQNGTWEVDCITFTLTALAGGAVCDPQPDVLDRLIKVLCVHVGANHIVGALSLVSIGLGVYQWTTDKPFKLERLDGLQISIDGRESFDIAYDGQKKRIDAIRVEVSLEGLVVKYANIAKPTFTGEGQTIS